MHLALLGNLRFVVFFKKGYVFNLNPSIKPALVDEGPWVRRTKTNK